MDLELLRTFLEVSRYRHFGNAAEALHLTQAAVSARIKLLESQLGVQLFDRIKRDIRLTSEGNRLVRHAESLIAGWRKARQEVSIGDANRQLTFGGGLRLWDVFLKDWLKDIRRAHPDLALIAESHSPEILTRRLLDGLVDLAFMIEPPQLDVLHIKSIATLELALISSKRDQTVEEALQDGYLMVDWGLSHALHHRRVFPDAPEPHTRLATTHITIDYLKTLGGSAYLPRRTIEHELDSGVLHVVENAPVFTHTTYAVYPVRSPKLKLIRELLLLFDDHT